jgi:hypothetical protein
MTRDSKFFTISQDLIFETHGVQLPCKLPILSIPNYTGVGSLLISTTNIQNINNIVRPRWKIIIGPLKIIHKTFVVNRKTTFAILIIVIAIVLLPILAYCTIGLFQAE